mgnify:CR=1 FL=1
MIETVKIQGQGYLLNDIMSVPKADGNRDYEEIKLWLSEGNVPEPEITEEELAHQELQTKLSEAQSYLTKTDYKMLNNYVPKEDEDLQLVITQRNTYREFIRENS